MTPFVFAFTGEFRELRENDWYVDPIGWSEMNPIQKAIQGKTWTTGKVHILRLAFGPGPDFDPWRPLPCPECGQIGEHAADCVPKLCPCCWKDLTPEESLLISSGVQNLCITCSLKN